MVDGVRNGCEDQGMEDKQNKEHKVGGMGRGGVEPGSVRLNLAVITGNLVKGEAGFWSLLCLLSESANLGPGNRKPIDLKSEHRCPTLTCRGGGHDGGGALK